MFECGAGGAGGCAPGAKGRLRWAAAASSARCMRRWEAFPRARAAWPLLLCTGRGNRLLWLAQSVRPRTRPQLK